MISTGMVWQPAARRQNARRPALHDLAVVIVDIQARLTELAFGDIPL